MKNLLILLAFFTFSGAASSNSSQNNIKEIRMAISFLHYLQKYSTNIDSLSHRFNKKIEYIECHDEDLDTGYQFVKNTILMDSKVSSTQDMIKAIMKYRAGELFVFSKDSMRIDFWYCSQASISNQPLKIEESEGPGNMVFQKHFSIDSNLSYGTENAFGIVCHVANKRLMVIQIEQSNSP